MNKKQVLEKLSKENVEFLRLQFIDILGIQKNVEVPKSQFQKALNGEIMFDGSSIDGFTRIEESDMLLKPDPSTFFIFPWGGDRNKTARLLCDVYTTDERPFEGCPRYALKKVVREAKDMGFEMYVGPEPEFFLFNLDEKGETSLDIHDNAGYFDLAPLDKGDDVRKEIVILLQNLGFEIEASHHEVAAGQHEIDFKYDCALKTADNITAFTFIVRKVAKQFGLLATFLPKPVYGINGSGMHLNQSLFKNGKNAFYDPKRKYQLSQTALYYIGGILEHAKAIVAITNPLVNSYKRLLPGYEAPVNIAWSLKNRSPLIRIPDKRGSSTRIEFRVPDPSANPYLAIAACLKAGLDGIKNKINPPDAVVGNIFDFSEKEKEKFKIGKLPATLSQALHYLKRDPVILDGLGKHIAKQFIDAKEKEWQKYSSQVHKWEIDNYITLY
ncbi:MAG: type I glutamate--ammonia ligase [Candidatus Delongbacteria bacterium]|nr:type I glutamate--ammonia ligase [Candidatus Delongbacteria bacterium]